MQLFKQKRIAITGAASGLGQALAVQFAKLGAQLCIADINMQAARAVYQQISSLSNAPHTQHLLIECDVGDCASIKSMAETIKQNWGSIDIIINNAGVASAGTLAQSTEQEWQWIVDINLLGVINSCRYFIPLIKQNSIDHYPGHVVNIASFAGIALAPGMVSYNVVKAGVIALSESIRGELYHKRVGVSVACPAFFKSNLTATMHAPNAKVLTQINQWMDKSKITADDVARDIIKGIKNQQFMIISHRYARHLYRFKRWFPEFYFSRLLKQISAVRRPKGNG